MTLAKRTDGMIESFHQTIEAVPNLTTPDVVGLFSQLKEVHKLSKTLEEKLKEILKERKSEGGRDSKGNTIFDSPHGAARLEPRPKYSFKEGAIDRLKELDLLKEFPQAPNIQSMRVMLQALGVEDFHYMEPQVSVEALEYLVEEGIIEDELAMELIDVQFTYAVRYLPQLKELTEGD